MGNCARFAKASCAEEEEDDKEDDQREEGGKRHGMSWGAKRTGTERSLMVAVPEWQHIRC